MLSPHHFLVVAESDDDRKIYSRTLLRRFPKTAVTEVGVAAGLLLGAQAQHCTGAVVNITGAGNALRLVSVLRAVNPRLPIVAVCTVDRSIDAFAAGASRFLLSGEWLMIGSVLAEVVEIANLNEQRRWSDAAPRPPVAAPSKDPAA
jgi:hypothetical protein